jgi:hypothetical protein
VDVVHHYILISLTLFRSLLSPVHKMHQLEKEGGKIEEKWPTESGQLLNKQSVALMKEAALWLA